MKKLVLVELVLLCLSTSLKAQTKLSPYYPSAQSLVAGFTCPAAAYLQACVTLKRMAAAGSDDVLAKFSTLFVAKGEIASAVSVVFDNDADAFWIYTFTAIGLGGAGVGEDDISIAHFMEGRLVNAAYGVVPHKYPDNVTSTDNRGDAISLTFPGPGSDVTLTSVETYPRSDGKVMSMTVVVKKTRGLDTESTAPADLTYQIGDNKITKSLAALRFVTSNMAGIDSLILAATQGDAEAVRLLLEEGVNVDSKDGSGDTALMCAAVIGRTEVVKLLLDKGASIEATNNEGDTPLTGAARMGHTEIVKLLLDKGANIEALGVLHETSLMLAARMGMDDVVKLLLDKGANINAKENGGETALSLALSAHKDKTAELLRARGAR